jgi:hypothetical protein
MAYQNETKSTAIEMPSLVGDGERLNGRLNDMAMRVAKIADTLHGTAPRDASAKPGAPVASSVRRNVDTAFEIVADIETELQRIESRL